MFVVSKKDPGADIEELPDEDASVLEIMRWNANRIYKNYLVKSPERTLALNAGAFVVACVCMNQYGELLSV